MKLFEVKIGFGVIAVVFGACLTFVAYQKPESFPMLLAGLTAVLSILGIKRTKE